MALTESTHEFLPTFSTPSVTLLGLDGTDRAHPLFSSPPPQPLQSLLPSKPFILSIFGHMAQHSHAADHSLLTKPTLPHATTCMPSLLHSQVQQSVLPLLRGRGMLRWHGHWAFDRP